jgi:hypothetical protein
LHPEEEIPMTGFSSNYPEELRERAQYREGVDAGRKSRDDRPADSHAGNGYEGEDRGTLDAWVCGYIDGWNERDSELRVARLAAETVK